MKVVAQLKKLMIELTKKLKSLIPGKKTIPYHPGHTIIRVMTQIPLMEKRT